MNPCTHLSALQTARSFLFVPGNRPDRFDKAARAGADAIIIDLEDAVPPAEKAAAQQALVAANPWLATRHAPVVIRLNDCAEDLQWLQRSTLNIDAVMWPKAASAAGVQAVVQALGPLGVIPLIESVAGCLQLAEIAAVPGVTRLALGHLDFMADSGIRCSDDERELDPLRFALCLHSRANQLPAPIDGVTVAVKDSAQLTHDVQRALRFGFGGKLCIHPAQVEGVHHSLRPSDADIAWAQRVLAAQANANGAAVQVDGQMVDRPVMLRAQALMARLGAG